MILRLIWIWCMFVDLAGSVAVRYLPLRYVKAAALYFRAAKASAEQVYRVRFYRNEIRRAVRESAELARFHRFGVIRFDNADIAAAAERALAAAGYRVTRAPGESTLVVEVKE